MHFHGRKALKTAFRLACDIPLNSRVLAHVLVETLLKSYIEHMLLPAFIVAYVLDKKNTSKLIYASKALYASV